LIVLSVYDKLLHAKLNDSCQSFKLGQNVALQMTDQNDHKDRLDICCFCLEEVDRANLCKCLPCKGMTHFLWTLLWAALGNPNMAHAHCQ